MVQSISKMINFFGKEDFKVGDFNPVCQFKKVEETATSLFGAIKKDLVQDTSTDRKYEKIEGKAGRIVGLFLLVFHLTVGQAFSIANTLYRTGKILFLNWKVQHPDGKYHFGARVLLCFKDLGRLLLSVSIGNTLLQGASIAMMISSQHGGKMLATFERLIYGRGITSSFLGMQPT